MPTTSTDSLCPRTSLVRSRSKQLIAPGSLQGRSRVAHLSVRVAAGVHGIHRHQQLPVGPPSTARSGSLVASRRPQDELDWRRARPRTMSTSLGSLVWLGLAEAGRGRGQEESLGASGGGGRSCHEASPVSVSALYLPSFSINRGRSGNERKAEIDALLTVPL